MNYTLIFHLIFFFKYGIQDARTNANEDKEKEKNYRYCSLICYILHNNYSLYTYKKNVKKYKKKLVYNL